MTTELSFLLDLLLDHKLPKPTRALIMQRAREVEEDMRGVFGTSGLRSPPIPQVQAALSNQAPSMQAIMARNQDLIARSPTIGMAANQPSIPVEQIAQTPATQAAMASRQSAIAESLSGKIDKVSGRPRKF